MPLIHVMPHAPLEGKFSVPFCIALGLRGYSVVSTDFNEKAFADPDVKAIVPNVKLQAVDGQAPHSAYLEVTMADGETLKAQTDIVLGHPDNPLSWDALREKFDALVDPVLGTHKARQLFDFGRSFLQPGSLDNISALLAA